MNSWFSVNLGDALLSQPRLDELQCYLAEIYEQEGRPTNMVASYLHQSADLHCHLTIFLTAEFQRIAMLENAMKCHAPNFNGISYLAGNSDLLVES